jgi:formamidopyrimidine-DNA glycosylase
MRQFGMSGQFRTAPAASAPEPKPTTRLRLMEIAKSGAGAGVCGLVSAQMLVHGGVEVYEVAKVKLGPDPLRDDADPERFIAKAASTSKSIGAVLMDQSFVGTSALRDARTGGGVSFRRRTRRCADGRFSQLACRRRGPAGVGNIYRAEICYKAKVHPDEPANLLSADQLHSVWDHSVDLLQRGFVSGSIITTDGEAAKAGRRRYVYNQSSCLCSARVKSWQIANRTAYACPACQPRLRVDGGPTAAAPPSAGVRDVKVFPSRCAPDAPEHRLAAPDKLRVAELRDELERRDLDTSGGKSALVARLSASLSAAAVDAGAADASAAPGTPPAVIAFEVKPTAGTSHLAAPTSATAAAAEKAAAGESRAVEHVADVSDRTDLATVAGKMNVADLRAALRERELDASGPKAALVQRLVAAVAAAGGTLEAAPVVRVKRESRAAAKKRASSNEGEVDDKRRSRSRRT